ncbi:Cytochrome c oxidase assembly protein cox20, mitochondrial [Yamadazyma tenuis]|uniref:Cytochrome c oxidase assembly protein COX20, mitochondrial n=1 Tax=Candida tenuis (strain ATCC 10573 / BCRC 21748 / CBS 615 / JCM 9827 / NBRC 10315 / NRRL Y-1498 / VKM Y-70) TaxID=590646 RepID=G3BFG4_CANTC|nr:uncharacterized protein CANTEDRAFT_116744 [Yamadazyma tenuis ATCC 10573]XP_006690438.1 uncharacterized protein CANTEDRAFT_116744 [Yamadazyma tenuis ATCC 10573]EGV61223.1 hypothetical protein CANTEDRAFT_116744 [Yamadazyma tenuis ATCC 10573]EGV61224.1 hypothetical protein CANTEDRAFT_116744 [Yamadazyma tenuis ATCC 10573]WEJ94063.1 Cytochrome c oxidase assembly protein cox20, mitochondrial [Yamadazyma tenuis]
MGWFGGNTVKSTPVTQVPEGNPQKFLEDLPPKFEDQGDVPGDASDQSMYEGALSQVRLADVKPSTYIGMPCFREAMMTGFQAMAVLGGVTFLIHKNPNKSLNWGVCGFFLGNIVGWEQCRSIRRKSFETVEKARQVKQQKNEQKWEDKASNTKDERLEKWRQVQEHYESKKK